MSISIAIAALVLFWSGQQAQAAEWVQIGSKEVKFAELRDTISLRGKNAFKKIRLCVEKRPVAMRDLDVVFANTTRQDVRVRRVIRAGTCTRAIDLFGGKRNIARIIMKYEPTPRGKPAIVNVYAR